MDGIAPEAAGLLGGRLNQLCRFADAERVLLDAVARDPRDWIAWSNLGNTMVELQRFGDAIACYGNALGVRPCHAPTLANLGVALTAMGRPGEALNFLDLAAGLEPDNAETQCNRALALLAAGDWEQGFAAYEWRWRTAAKPANRHRAPLWDGRGFDGRTLLLHDEGGFGDTLQFVRYAAFAKSLGGSVLLEVRPALAGLLARAPGIDRVITHGEPLPAYDLQCPMFSLPGLCATTPDRVPCADGYLSADPDRVSRWRRRLPAGIRIGLVWAGGPHPYARESALADARRSIHLTQLAPLAAAQPDATFCSLQIGAAAAQASCPPDGMRLIDHTAEIASFEDTAALICNLDLVVSVDTATAHLAAALGRPVRLLSRYDQCWRWLTGRTDTPWYRTMRLYQQPAPFDWRTPITRLAADLACEIIRTAVINDPMTRPGLCPGPAQGSS